MAEEVTREYLVEIGSLSGPSSNRDSQSADTRHPRVFATHLILVYQKSMVI